MSLSSIKSCDIDNSFQIQKSVTHCTGKTHKSDNSILEKGKRLEFSKSKSKPQWEEFSNSQSGENSQVLEYSISDKKLLFKVCNDLWPKYMNKIRASLIRKGDAQMVSNIYNAVERMAFERDPDK